MSERPTSGGLSLLLFAAALFAAGGVWFLSKTVVQAVRHPAYSTLSAAPEGTRALYEALSRIPLDTMRLYEPGGLPPGATLFRIGQPLSEDALRTVAADSDEAAFVVGGGRLVCAFAGWKPDPRPTHDTPSGEPTNRPPAGTAARLTQGLSLVALTNLAAQARTPLSDACVPWYSAACFELAPEATNRWRTLYTLDGHPVMIESRFGKGSLVLATDCYFLSNEALVSDRRPALLAGLVGASHAVLFDETVHGIRERHNTTWLLCRYRLHLLVAVLALLFLLTLWQHACPLLPRIRASSSDTPLRGFHMEDGLVSLLRRHLPVARLPRQLFETWQQTAPKLDEATRLAMLLQLDRAEAFHEPPEETCRTLHRLAQNKRHSAAREDTRPPPPAESLEGERPREPFHSPTTPLSKGD